MRAWNRAIVSAGAVLVSLSAGALVAPAGAAPAAAPRDVVAWGATYNGQGAVPAGLGRLVAVDAGYTHTLGLRADGTVVAWGSNGGGESDVPAG
ncbi:MAG: hypothetical protein JWR70_3599, partial [Modestobacter sp.]|nr:hypothetical protein [Modestobacter sp.]